MESPTPHGREHALARQGSPYSKTSSRDSNFANGRPARPYELLTCAKQPDGKNVIYVGGAEARTNGARGDRSEFDVQAPLRGATGAPRNRQRQQQPKDTARRIFPIAAGMTLLLAELAWLMALAYGMVWLVRLVSRGKRPSAPHGRCVVLPDLPARSRAT